MANNNDLVSQISGNFGKWQLKAVLIIFLCKIPTSWFMAIIIYSAPAPTLGDYWCTPPQKCITQNPKEWITLVHPTYTDSKTNKTLIDYCNIYKEVYDGAEINFEILKKDTLFDRNNSTIIPCTDFTFQSDFHSLIAEYDLVCTRKLFTSLSQCFHIFGLFLGGILAVYLLKTYVVLGSWIIHTYYILLTYQVIYVFRYSPRRVMLIGMMSQIAFGVLCGAIKHFEFHVLFRCLVAISCALMYTSGQMICKC